MQVALRTLLFKKDHNFKYSPRFQPRGSSEDCIISHFVPAVETAGYIRKNSQILMKVALRTLLFKKDHNFNIARGFNGGDPQKIVSYRIVDPWLKPRAILANPYEGSFANFAFV